MIRRFLVIILGIIFLTGCMTQKNIPLNESFWRKNPHKVAIVSLEAPKPGITMQGPQGLLDIAINKSMTRKLDNHLANTKLSWYQSLPDELGKKLKERKITIVNAGSTDDDDAEEVAEIASAHHADDVLLIKLQTVGVVRRYYGFIPLGAPEAYSVLKGELRDASGKLKWRHLAQVRLPIPGKWDQPPTYPNVTSAVNKATDISRKQIIDSFFEGH